MSGSLSDAEKEASRWIARLESADVTLDDHKRFRAWLAASPDNKAAYEAVNRTWDALDLLKHGHTPIDVPPRSNRRRLLLAGAALAGVAVVAVVGLTSLGAASEHRTGIGERTTARLEDGSTAELNAASSLRVRFTERERRVDLERGEALFDVTPDPARPFIVRTPFGDVRVRGTSFVVRLSETNARVTVLHGAVEIIPAAAETIIARETDEVSIERGSAQRTSVAAATLERRVAWRSGMLAFDGETLAEAALKIERQTGARFEFADAATANMRVGGYISASDTPAFVALLEDNLGLEVIARSGDAFFVSRPSP